MEFGLSNDEIAQRVGKSRSTIANLRGLLRLPDAVLNQVGPGEGQIPQGVARTLSQVAKFKGAAKDIEQIGARIVKGDLTGFDAEDRIGPMRDQITTRVCFQVARREISRTVVYRPGAELTLAPHCVWCSASVARPGHGLTMDGRLQAYYQQNRADCDHSPRDDLKTRRASLLRGHLGGRLFKLASQGNGE